MLSISPTVRVFLNNTAKFDGGVIYAYGSLLYVSNSAFSGSFAGLFGSVMYLNKSLFFLSKNSFSDNTAQIHGGVFYVMSFFVARSTFTRNLALMLGRVTFTSDLFIHLETFFITDSIFNDNFAFHSRVVASLASFHFDNITFSGNTAQNFSGVFATYGIFHVVNSNFTNKIVLTGQGGAIVSSNATYHIVNCSFHGNRTGSSSGIVVTKRFCISYCQY